MTEMNGKRTPGRQAGQKVARKPRRVVFLPEVLEERRIALGLTQSQLADRLEVDQSRVSALEISDGSTVPGGPTLYLLSKALDLPMEAFLQELPPED